MSTSLRVETEQENHYLTECATNVIVCLYLQPGEGRMFSYTKSNIIMYLQHKVKDYKSVLKDKLKAWTASRANIDIKVSSV